MADVLTIDYETRSPIDIKRCGAYAYAASSYTSPMMLAIKEDDRETRMWIAPYFRNLMETEVGDEELQKLIQEAGVIVAHNAFFERSITHFHMPFELPLKKVRCTMAQSCMCGLPRDLDSVAKIVSGGKYLKDRDGHTLMLAMSKPRRLVKTDCERLQPLFVQMGYSEVESDWRKIQAMQKSVLEELAVGRLPADKRLLPYFLVYRESQEEFVRLVEYARQDVRVEYMIYTKLPKLPEAELKVWQLDQQINDRGVQVDVVNAEGISRTLEKYIKELGEEALALTDYEVTSIKSPTSIIKWLRKHGVDVTSIDKESIKYLLTLDLDPKVRKFLEIRQALGKSSVAKYDALLAEAFYDNRCHGLFVYHGAGTGRWAGAGVQPQNLPRPSGSKNLVDTDLYGKEEVYADELDATLLAFGDIGAVKLFWKDPMILSADLLRTMFMAPCGRDFVCADYSAVEARGIAWLAGQENVLRAFVEGLDIYKVAASGIYKIPYEEVDGGGKGEQRQVGKTAILACGFGGGYAAMLRFGADKLGINEEEGTAIVKAWREANSKIVEFWYALTRASVKAMQSPGDRFYAGKRISFRKQGEFLTMRLPSGRNLYYPYPKLESIEMPWSTDVKPVYKKVVTAMTQNVAKQWVREPLSHVKLSENATQGTCRDLLVNGAFNITGAGYDIVLHVHDEIVAEADEGEGNLAEFEALMAKLPDWAEGFPLKAEGWIGKRYRK